MDKKTENQIIEWKESWHDKYLEWICGYANAQGGFLYIGIDDDGKVVGIKEEEIKRLLEDIPNKISSLLGITCDINEKVKQGKHYIQIEVKKSNIPLNIRGHYFYRTGSIKKEIIGFELIEFIMKNIGVSYDEMASDIDIENLTFDYLSKRYYEVTGEKLEISKDLISFKLTKDNKKATNAGILFADQWNIYHSRVFCTRWKGIKKSQ